MINLYEIKRFGDYDYIQDSVPNANGTWLCSDDITGYTKGYSYQVEQASGGGIATRIEVNKDNQILSSIYPTIETVCEWLNNYFYVKRQNNSECKYDNKNGSLTIRESKEYQNNVGTYGNYIFSNSTISGVQINVFQNNDLVRLTNSIRNNYVTSITNVTSDVLTIDNENCTNTTEDCRIMLMVIPNSVQKAICQMIYYDVFIKENPDNLQSESVGNYSYTKATVLVGSLYYPPDLVSGLQAFKKVRFV